LTIAYDLQLPALLDRTYALARILAHHLQYHDGEQNEADVAHHRLIHAALARLQPRKLLGVAKERLDAPAAHLAQNYRGEIPSRIVCEDVLVVA